MTEEELAISQSTPNYRFDQHAPAPPADSTPAEEPLRDDAVAFVDEVIGDPAQPVVLFALEWCEFCWGVRKLFARLGIPYRAIDLDSVAFQEGNRGGEIRKVLKSRLGTNTIPQIYIGGQHIGGATDAYAAWNQGKIRELQKRVDTIPEVEAELTRLNRDYNVTKGQYESLVSRRETARLSEQAEQKS
ncbi:MAG: glutaredoxin domain-containing protein, partial [Xanthomonadales bacterium]|nr:glutaredoxin domain-containing protein [Xanthomonadales bacterium]